MTIDSLAPTATFRPASSADIAFLRDLYAGLPRSDGHAPSYPAVVDELIEVSGVPVGRVMVGPMRSVAGGRDVIDLTVLATWRGHGLGTAALLRWAEVAHADGGPLAVTLLHGDPVVGFFHRLGFRYVRAAASTRVRMVLDAVDGHLLRAHGRLR
jgi:GNAT superfamily N-acetyltransferase